MKFIFFGILTVVAIGVFLLMTSLPAVILFGTFMKGVLGI